MASRGWASSPPAVCATARRHSSSVAPRGVLRGDHGRGTWGVGDKEVVVEEE